MSIMEIEDGVLEYIPEFIHQKDADLMMEKLRTQTEWRKDKIKIFGRVFDVPRLQAWYGDKDAIYSYSSIDLQPLPWTDELIRLKERIEKYSGNEFNSVLLNLYRDGSDSNGWHSDDEKELGKDPYIASISLGQERVMHFKHKTKKLKHSILLEHGSLLLMGGPTQTYWKHQIPKSKRVLNPRINLTFRRIFT